MPLWLISIALGIVVAFVVVGTMKSQLKTVRPQSGAGSYMRPNSLRLHISTDTFLFQNTTRTPRPKPKK